MAIEFVDLPKSYDFQQLIMLVYPKWVIICYNPSDGMFVELIYWKN